MQPDGQWALAFLDLRVPQCYLLFFNVYLVFNEASVVYRAIISLVPVGMEFRASCIMSRSEKSRD